MNNTKGTSITINTIKEMMALRPKEPFAEFMISKGCDPKDGYKLIIPFGLIGDTYFLPDYVVESHLVALPTIITTFTFDRSFRYE